MTGTYNIIFAGVGGQGVITASGLLASAAISSGLDVRMYGSYGMSQRGGMVSANVRIGDKVLNARIEKGEARLVVGMDIMEAVRWAPFLSREGRLITHSGLIPPAGKVLRNAGKALLEFLGEIPGAAVLDAGKLAGSAGSRGMNAVLLGAACAMAGFPVGSDALEARMTEDFGAGAGPVIEAFRAGRAALG